jgi:hypothetical protein
MQARVDELRLIECAYEQLKCIKDIVEVVTVGMNGKRADSVEVDEGWIQKENERRRAEFFDRAAERYELPPRRIRYDDVAAPKPVRIEVQSGVSADVAELAEKIRIAPFPMPLRIEMGGAGGTIFIVFHARVYDRATGAPCPLQHRQSFFAEHLASTRERPEVFLAGMVRRGLRELLAHELDECIRVDGAIAFDPHRGSAA